MRSINLRTLSIEIREDIFPLYEKSLSDRDEEIKIRREEIELVRIIVNNFIFAKLEENGFEDWFYSFSIPQIGKEFDLLKIGKNNKILNIELKSQEVPIGKIEKQLVQNRYYLEHVATDIYSFTCVKSADGTIHIYKWEDNAIRKTSFEEVIKAVNLIQDAVNNDIEKLFEPKDYLISPLNTPQKFLGSCYYLTNQQEQIKNKVIGTITNDKKIWGIRGSAGTGKTLLLYDIAKKISETKYVGVIHCGLLNEGHKYLNEHMNNIVIIDAKSITEKWISKFDVICVDETQRLYKSSLDLILQKYEEGAINACIFSYDSMQALSKAEVKRNNIKRLLEIPIFSEEVLSEKIRTNKEIFSFIRNMMRLYDKPQKTIRYDNIDILYANNTQECDMLTKNYRERGYKQIAFTPSRFCPNSIDHYSEFTNSHQVIGQEFDKVLMVMDNNFRYDADGELEGKEHPNPDYLFPRLFYQNISRAREKLCIVVVDNFDFFDKLLHIKENDLDFERPVSTSNT